jgi:hypothetical protein
MNLNELTLGCGVATPPKKGEEKIKDSLQKLLKTHLEKMSAFGSEQKLLKTQPVRDFLKLC